jgi:hypothetical protein
VLGTGVLVGGPAAGAHVGSYDLAPSGAVDSDYTISYAKGTLKVTPAPLTITADPQTSVYGAAYPSFTWSPTGLVNRDLSGVLGAGVLVGGPAAGAHVGNYDLTPSGAVDSDYTISYAKGTLKVTPAPLTITADPQTSVYGAAYPSFTWTPTGLVNRDLSGVLGAGVLVGGPAAGAHVGNYDLTPSGAVDSDYIISYAKGTLTVIRADTKIVATSQTSTYSEQAVSLTLAATVTNSSTSPVVNEGAVTFTIQAAGGATIGSPASVNVANGAASAAYTLPAGVPGTQAGTYAIIASFATSPNFNSSSDSSHSLVISPRLTNTVANPQSATFGDGSVVLSATVSATGSSINQATMTFTLLNSSGAVVGTAAISGAVSGGSASVSYALPNATPAGMYTIQAHFDGNSNLSPSQSTATLTINKKPTTTVETNSPSSLQYSDQVVFSATVSPASVPGVQLTGTVQFIIGTTSYGSASIDNTGLARLAPQQIFLAPGTYSVKATFTPTDTANFLGSTGSLALTITQEDARAYYTGALFASTGSINSFSATVTLAATIKDITAVTGDPAWDQYPGDIRNATVQFVNRDVLPSASNYFLCSAPIGLVSLSDTTVGTATCNVSLGASSTAGGTTYTIGMIVGGYYTRNWPVENQVVDVYIPQNNFITGGGYLNNTSSAGLYPGATGQRTNFGFNVKYNKSGTNLQGNINVIVRNNGRVYQIKGNSMTSLATQVCTATSCPTAASPSTATFNGKATIQDITDPVNPISIDGNATLQVTMTDFGSPASDKIGITVWNKSGGLWFASNWNGTQTAEQTLAGGNLSVH